MILLLAVGALWCRSADPAAGETSDPDVLWRPDARPHLRLGPMVGHAGPREARLWVKASGRARLDVLVSEREDLGEARWIQGPVLGEESEFAGQIEVGGLEPGRRYYYVVRLNRREAMTPPYPSFQTASEPGTTERLRVAFTSCSGYAAPDPAAGMADLAVRTNVDLLLMLGDNHYANSPEPDKQRVAYDHQRQSAGFKDLTRRTPTYGIWDDHDFGPDNSDGKLEGKERALAMFKEHWANPAYGEEDHPGVYYAFTRGAVDFFMLDGRYYRTPNKEKDEGQKTMLGARQLEWLKRALSASTARVKIIASGSEWQSRGTEDGWASFKRERDEIFAHIEQERIEGVILISGDRHFTAAYQVNGRFLEVTSGPIGGNTATTRELPEMILKQDQGRFYCVLDLDTRPVQPAVTLEVYRIGTGRVARREFSWEEINGAAKIAK